MLSCAQLHSVGQFIAVPLYVLLRPNLELRDVVWSASGYLNRRHDDVTV